jgi:hypothetical protein
MSIAYEPTSVTLGGWIRNATGKDSERPAASFAGAAVMPPVLLAAEPTGWAQMIGGFTRTGSVVVESRRSRLCLVEPPSGRS